MHVPVYFRPYAGSLKLLIEGKKYDLGKDLQYYNERAADFVLYLSVLLYNPRAYRQTEKIQRCHTA